MNGKYSLAENFSIQVYFWPLEKCNYQMFGASGRHGGDGRFSRPVAAGIFNQAGRDLTPRRKDARAQRKTVFALQRCAFALKNF
jgi:hypothetical protein